MNDRSTLHYAGCFFFGLRKKKYGLVVNKVAKRVANKVAKRVAKKI